MKHCLCNISDLTIDLNEVYRSMGYDNIPDDDIKELTDLVLAEIEPICKPQYLYTIYQGEVLDKNSIQINGKNFNPGKVIHAYLSGTSSFCVFVTTAGHELDAYKQQARADGDLVKEFILDSLGSVIAEACVSKISEELAQLPDLEQTYSYSPGYCGWKLTEQQILFSLLPDSPCGITLTESCLMLPIKSISGIISLGKEIERKAYGCTICDNINCYKRKKN